MTTVTKFTGVIRNCDIQIFSKVTKVTTVTKITGVLRSCDAQAFSKVTNVTIVTNNTKICSIHEELLQYIPD